MTQPIKPYFKNELAQMYGVSLSTLKAWIEPFRKELEEMGYYSEKKILSVKMVTFLFEKLGHPESE